MHCKDWSSSTLATWCKGPTHWKKSWCWERLRAGEGVTENEMVGWHHSLNAHEFEQTLGDSEGQGSWPGAVYEVSKNQTRLSDFTFTFHFHALEKEMATHSSILAWRIPGTTEPGGLAFTGLHRVRHDWIDLAATAVSYPTTQSSHLYTYGLIFTIMNQNKKTCLDNQFQEGPLWRFPKNLSNI